MKLHGHVLEVKGRRILRIARLDIFQTRTVMACSIVHVTKINYFGAPRQLG